MPVTDAAPVISGVGGTTNLGASYGSPSSAIAPTLTVSDADNTTLAFAQVSITSGLQPGDMLYFVNNADFGNMTGSYDSGTGVLTLISSGAVATLAQWQNALQSVAYVNFSSSFNAADRTISFTINDGLTDSATVTETIHFPPSFGGAGGTTILTAAAGVAPSSVAITPGLTLADSDPIASATIAVSGGFHAGEDVLAFTNAGAGAMGDISGSYDASTGVLTLASSGQTATLAQWQAALASVTYADSSSSFAAADRTISLTASDSAGNSATTTQTIHFQVDAPPTLGGLGATVEVALTAGGSHAPVVVAPGLTVGDADNVAEASASVAITSGFHAGEDVLAFANTAGMGDIAGSYDAATGVLTLTSAGATATLAEWQAALDSVSYDDTASDPTAGNRILAFTVNDGVASSAAATQTVNVAVTSPPPPPESPEPAHDGQDGDMTLTAGGSVTTGDGQDTVTGAGHNTIIGGAGDNLIVGGPGANYLHGGAGADVIYGGSGFDNINGNQGDDTINGGTGGGDWLIGGQGDDFISAGPDASILFGNLGKDTLTGGDGADLLRGGQGDDVIDGGAGADWISGDLGNDTLTGGPGADTFHVFSGDGIDVVTDFKAAEGDRVQVDAGTAYTVAQSGADVIVALGKGDELILKNVQLANLPAGWIFSA